MKNLTVALWSLLLFFGPCVAFAQETEEEITEPTIQLVPMRGDTVGKNIPVKLTVSTGEVSDEGIPFPAEMVYATKVYYTIDGITEPSDEAYEAQNGEAGPVMMVENVYDEENEEFIVDENNLSYISLTFNQNVRLKAKAYMTMPNNLHDIQFETGLFDRDIKVKSEANPAFMTNGAEAASGKAFYVGDTLIIKNPGSEEKMSEMYFSFDGTKPTRWAYDAQPDAKYGQWHVFKMAGRETEDILITFCKDEQGFYAHIADVMNYATRCDTIRIEDGKFQIMAFCESFVAENSGEAGDDHFGVVVEMPFSYGSDFVEATYTVSERPVAKPTFDPAADQVEKGTKVAILCETEGATIYYTVDNTEPTAESTVYTTAIEINHAMIIKAIAIKGDAKSEVAEAAYTIKPEAPEEPENPGTANEAEELAGVTVYPNPSNGLFHLDLPVAATVEVFTANGVLLQHMEAAAGETTLNINRSGIYFIRIASEGRSTVKRVIVR